MTTCRPAFPGVLAAALIGGLTLVLLASCANGAPGPTAGSQPNSGSASPAGTARPAPASSASPRASGTGSATCGSTGAPLIIRPGDQPNPVCVHPGDILTLTAAPSPTQPWQPLTTTDPATLACTTRTGADGALTATCKALRPGAATVSTGTAAFSGDPHGPAQYFWTLTVNVSAAP